MNLPVLMFLFFFHNSFIQGSKEPYTLSIHGKRDRKVIRTILAQKTWGQKTSSRNDTMRDQVQEASQAKKSHLGALPIVDLDYNHLKTLVENVHS